MNVNDILKNQALTEKILTGKITNKQDLCEACNCTFEEAENLFSEISSICNKIGVDPSSLDEGDLDKVSGGFGLTKNQKSRAVVAGLLATTGFGVGIKPKALAALDATAGIRVSQQMSLASENTDFKQLEKNDVFDEITKKTAAIAQIKPYTSLHIYSKQERDDARATVEDLQKLAREVASRYSHYNTDKRIQLAAHNLEATVLNCQTTLNEKFFWDRNAVYNYGECEKDLRNALALYERKLGPVIAESNANEQRLYNEQLKREEEKVQQAARLIEQIKTEFESKKKTILSEYREIQNEASTVLRNLEKTLTKGQEANQDELTKDLKAILNDIAEPCKKLETMKVPDNILALDSLESAEGAMEVALSDHRATCQEIKSRYSAIREEATETMKDLNDALMQCSKDEYQARLEAIEEGLQDKFASQGLNEVRTAKVQKILEDIYAELAVKKEEVKNYNDIKNQNKIKRSLESFDRFISSKEAMYRSVLDQHQAELKKMREQENLKRIREAMCYPQQRETALANGLLKFEDLVSGFPRYEKDKHGKEKLNDLEAFMEAYDKNNASEPDGKGFILCGPPGTGKTTQVKYLALSKGYNVVTLSRDVLSKSNKEPEKVIREYYEKAKDVSKNSGTVTVLLLDEIDTIGQDRGGVKAGDDKSTNELMTIAESNTKSTGVAIIGTTNHYDRLDSALTRRGRMGLKKDVPPPAENVLWDVFVSRVKHFPAQNCNNVQEFLTDVKSKVSLESLTPADVDDWCTRSIIKCREASPGNDILKTVLRTDIFRDTAETMGFSLK